MFGAMRTGLMATSAIAVVATGLGLAAVWLFFRGETADE